MALIWPCGLEKKGEQPQGTGGVIRGVQKLLKVNADCKKQLPLSPLHALSFDYLQWQEIWTGLRE